MIRNLEEGLKQINHTVEHHIIERDTEIPLFHYLPKNPRYVITRPVDYAYLNFARREIEEAVESFGPDIIHATHLRLLPALEVANNRDIPSVLSVHAKELKYTRLATSAIEAASTIHAVSGFTAELVENLVPDTETNVIHPSIDVEYYHSVAQDATSTGDVLTLSRFVDRKNIRMLIDVWKSLPTSTKEGRMLKVVGDGPNRRKLEERAANHDDIEFLGFVNMEEKGRLLAESELFALVPLQDGYDVEGFGIVWIEAQAAGTPVIGSSYGGAPEAIGDAGVIVESPSNEDEVRAALQTMLDSNIQTYQQAARRRIKGFDILPIAKEHDRVYQSLLS
ncbi:glycosyltransferase family 4 protein [Halobacterium sp. NMX12-1]|uniref:Glycosyltransferase family 4 protein n=1 Tax=Halobacterium sp. NMX12-1 TaxID=3166650 RepID=A0AAU8CC05_9EURY